MDGALLSNGKVKEKWGCVKEETNLCDDDHSITNHQFPWPAKNYSCNFCRREFKSAQALGGHMNVHRRDRARLRLLPSWVPENSCPNPNFYPLSSHYSSFKSTSSTGPQDHDRHTWLCSTKEKDDHGHQEEEEEVQVVKKKKKIQKSNWVNLELKMGIHHHHLEGSKNEDGLDLELRL